MVLEFMLLSMMKQPVWGHNSNGRKFVIFAKHWRKAQIKHLKNQIMSLCEVFLANDVFHKFTFSLLYMEITSLQGYVS